jgi:signal transduction histidine kinase
MRDALKQFAAKVIALPSDPFQRARLRLTALYVALLIGIVGISSLVTYSIFSGRLENRFHERSLAPEEIAELHFPQEARDELLASLLIVNGSLFLIALGASYYLAGSTLRPIQQAYERQRLFLSDASHELRTPLAILQIELENKLAEPQASRQEKESARSHMEEVLRMRAIVEDLLLLSRLDAREKAAPRAEQVDVSAILKDAVSRLGGYAAKHDVTLAIEPPAPAPLMIRAHAEHILQAVSNVIKNGIDYNRPKGKVTVGIKGENGTAVITIADTGSGIAAEEIPRLFTRFYRVDKSRSRLRGGSGLGLAIAQSIVRAHGGSISLRSQPGQGTTVIISLPYGTPA